VRFILPALLCALVFHSLSGGSSSNGQEQPETPRPAGQRRGGPVPRPEPPQAGKQIVLDVLIADLAEGIDNPTAAKILDLEKTGKLALATRLKVATLDELPGFIKFGGSVAGRTISSSDRGGDRGGFGVRPPTGASDSGVQLQATTRIEEGGAIVMQIYLERPASAVPQSLAPADGSVEAGNRFAFLSQNTVRLRSGEPTIISGRSITLGSEKSQTWAVVTATVGP
jgi:hypothetical protein